MLKSNVETTIENKVANKINLLKPLKSPGGFTEIFSKKPNKIPDTVVNNALSRRIES